MFNKKIVMNKSGSLAILVPLLSFEALPFLSRVHKGLVMNDTGQKKKKEKIGRCFFKQLVLLARGTFERNRSPRQH